MAKSASLITSTVGKKAVMAITGLLLVAFLVVHLAGNLLLLAGPEAFNGYARTLEELPLTLPAEILLAGVFLVHVTTGVWLTLENRAGRPDRYQVHRGAGASTFESRHMLATGALTLLFLGIHLANFRFSDFPLHPLGLWGAVVDLFGRTPWSVYYIAAMVVLFLHVRHGLPGAFRSLGLDHPRYTPWIERLGILVAALLAGGFAALPLGTLLAGEPLL